MVFCISDFERRSKRKQIVTLDAFVLHPITLLFDACEITDGGQGPSEVAVSPH